MLIRDNYHRQKNFKFFISKMFTHWRVHHNYFFQHVEILTYQLLTTSTKQQWNITVHANRENVSPKTLSLSQSFKLEMNKCVIYNFRTDNIFFFLFQLMLQKYPVLQVSYYYLYLLLFSTEPGVNPGFESTVSWAGLGIHSFQKNVPIFFPFFIKERFDLCILFRSL